MGRQQPKYPLLDTHVRQEIETRFQDALAYFKRRKSVLFFSYSRFWEKHAFVQQSLAKFLVQNGIRVTWIDGTGWRPYRPVMYFNSPLLEVKQGLELPGRRFPLMHHLSEEIHVALFKKKMRQLGGNPVVWIQGGMDDGIAEKLPYIDVFSTFDDPYRNPPTGHLIRKSKVILCQNSFTYELLGGRNDSRLQISLPPVDMEPGVFEASRLSLPAGFPQKIMGYIGTYFGEDYDLTMFENFMQCLPDWGFMLMGRTGYIGRKFINRFIRYPNFIYFPWVPRSQVAAAWQLLDVTLLLYRPRRSQDGAFPTKILESTYFGVPAVATATPKTLDLEGFFPRSSFRDDLRDLSVQVAEMTAARVSEIYRHFAYESNPKLHLAKAAEALKKWER